MIYLILDILKKLWNCSVKLCPGARQRLHAFLPLKYNPELCTALITFYLAIYKTILGWKKWKTCYIKEFENNIS